MTTPEPTAEQVQWAIEALANDFRASDLAALLSRAERAEGEAEVLEEDARHVMLCSGDDCDVCKEIRERLMRRMERRGVATDATVERADVTSIIAAVNGENDGPDWLGVFTLKDGRFLVASGGCDYTGWDCQAGNNLTVCATMADVLQFGLSPEERGRLGL